MHLKGFFPLWTESMWIFMLWFDVKLALFHPINTILFYSVRGNQHPKSNYILVSLIWVDDVVTGCLGSSIKDVGTGKSLSEALIFASTNPQYNNILLIVHENCKLRIPAEHVVYTNCCFCFDIQNNFGTQHVLKMLRASIFQS